MTLFGENLRFSAQKVITNSQRPFVMKFWALDYVFLPAKYLVDVKRADTQTLNFMENISEVSLFKDE